MNISKHLLFIHLETLSAFVVVIVVIYPLHSLALTLSPPSLATVTGDFYLLSSSPVTPVASL